jgi:hypothetical protein
MDGTEEKVAGSAGDRLGEYLARVVAHCEQLAEDPTLPEEVRERARRALVAAIQATEAWRAMKRA